MGTVAVCGSCGLRVQEVDNYCGECGVKIGWEHEYTPSGARCTCGLAARECEQLQRRLQLQFNRMTKETAR